MLEVQLSLRLSLTLRPLTQTRSLCSALWFPAYSLFIRHLVPPSFSLSLSFLSPLAFQWGQNYMCS
uniref:Uncharacterized protein n=1 Tax=Anguilla anguilla TaxID=7936 RepID=A0A0E9QIZ1_ANGAN